MGSLHQLDHIVGFREVKKLAAHYCADEICSITIDHNAVSTKSSMLADNKKSNPKSCMNWLKLINPVNRAYSNEHLKCTVDDCVDLGCEECCKCAIKAVSKAAREANVEHNGWFELSKDILNPVLEERKRLLMKANSSPGNDETLRKLRRDAKNTVKDTVSVAKSK